MLPYRESIEQMTDDELAGESDGVSSPSSSLSDSEKLYAAFQNVGLFFVHSQLRWY